MSITAPRFSDRAVKYLEEFSARPEEVPLSLHLEQILSCGAGDDTISYDGPHLKLYTRSGIYGLAALPDPVTTIAVGSRSFVMSISDVQAVGGRYVELLPVHSSRGGYMYVLAIV
jgi:hypothetical protein